MIPTMRKVERWLLWRGGLESDVDVVFDESFLLMLCFLLLCVLMKVKIGVYPSHPFALWPLFCDEKPIRELLWTSIVGCNWQYC